MSFGLACDGIDDIAGAERHVNVGHVVLVEKCGVVRGNAHAKNADIGIFQDEMMVGFFCCGNGDRRLSTERKCEKKQERTKKWPQSVTSVGRKPTAKEKLAR